MEEIVNYLANHQERMRFPDRQAKQIRNHPFMTQLDFFDTNEEQKRAWEVQKRKEEVKEIATQAATSEAMEATKKTESTYATAIVPPDLGGRGRDHKKMDPRMSRREATEQYDDDVERMRLNPSMYKEHDAESKTLRHERGNKSDSMAQSVRFSLGRRVAHPDAPDVPVYPGIRKPTLPIGVPAATNSPAAVGEHVPVPIGIRERVGIKVPVRVADDEEVTYDIFAQDEVAGDLKVPQREEEMHKDGALTFMLKRFRAAISEKLRKPTPEELEEAKAFEDAEARMAWYLQQKEDERDGSIQAYIDGQAKGEQRGVIDSMLELLGGGKADEDPSSSSASAVRPKARAKSQERPHSHPVSAKIAEGSKPFTVRGKDFDTPNARIYQGGDPNRMRQREARLTGA